MGRPATRDITLDRGPHPLRRAASRVRERLAPRIRLVDGSAPTRSGFDPGAADSGPTQPSDFFSRCCGSIPCGAWSGRSGTRDGSGGSASWRRSPRVSHPWSVVESCALLVFCVAAPDRFRQRFSAKGQVDWRERIRLIPGAGRCDRARPSHRPRPARPRVLNGRSNPPAIRSMAQHRGAGPARALVTSAQGSAGPAALPGSCMGRIPGLRRRPCSLSSDARSR